MSLQVRLYLLLGLMLGILYAVILGVSYALGWTSFMGYAILAVGLVFVQYLLGPSMVSLLMRIKYVSEQEQPKLHQMAGIVSIATEFGILKNASHSVGSPF